MASTAVDAARSAGGGAEPDAPKQARRGVLEEARSPVAPSKRAKRSGSSGKAPMEEASPSPSRQGLRDAPAAPASYSTLLNDTAGADIMFEVDGERIPAHRSVLAAQSLYFMEMFDAGPSTGGSETGGGALRLQVQAPAGAVRVLLRFLYSGAMPESDDCGESLQPGEMVRMADRAQAHELFQHCLRVFCGGLRKENVIERLVDAEECGPPALRSAIIEWIRKNISHLKKDSKPFLDQIQRIPPSLASSLCIELLMMFAGGLTEDEEEEERKKKDENGGSASNSGGA